MSDTIELQPESAEPHRRCSKSRSRRDRRSPKLPRPRRTARLFVIAGALLTLVLVLGGALVYVLFLRYVPTARLHVPGNANFAARFEAADVALFAPVRKQAPSPMLDTPSSPSRSRRVPRRRRAWSA